MESLKIMVELNVQLHILIKNEMGESDEADIVRDKMDLYWDDLSEDDQEWLRKLSASLYVLWESSGRGQISDEN
jgi:hypothetical protein